LHQSETVALIHHCSSHDETLEVALSHINFFLELILCVYIDATDNHQNAMDFGAS